MLPLIIVCVIEWWGPLFKRKDNKTNTVMAKYSFNHFWSKELGGHQP